MPTTHWDQASRAELYVRSDLPAPAKQCHAAIRSRLDSLVASGVLEEFSVTSWAKRVPLASEDGDGEFERGLYDAFSEWAATANVGLQPFFDTRECYSKITGERRTELVVPAACLALYDDADALVSVVPHATEAGTVSIRDRLADLADEAVQDPARTARTAD